VPYSVIANTDSGDPIVYDVCLERGEGSKNIPAGLSVLTPIIIPEQHIRTHCEIDHEIPGFIPFGEPDIVEVTQPTTVAQLLETNDPSACYSFHKDPNYNYRFYGGSGWEQYEKATERDMIVAYFVYQGAKPLPPYFNEGGTMTGTNNACSDDAIIPPGEYEFYGAREVVAAEMGTDSLDDSEVEACGSMPAFIVPVPAPVECYHGFEAHESRYHQANDFRITLGVPGFAPAAGSIKMIDGFAGGRVVIDHGGCWYSMLGHSTPLVEVGQTVTQGQQVTVSEQVEELEWQIIYAPRGFGPGGPPDSLTRYDGSALGLGYSCGLCPDC
jgi:hypothetical protein